MTLGRLKIQDAKPIFVFTASTELVFLWAARRWAFPIQFTLAKTGLRVGELVHLLIEELDLDGGWLLVLNKKALGWRVMTGDERDVPMLPEEAAVLTRIIHTLVGPAFPRSFPRPSSSRR